MSSIDEIKARLDIVDLVSQTVQLRRTGRNYTGFCPFHPNSRTPAFVVFPESGTWRCFGQCNEGGDIFRFVMKKEGWDFNEALRFLADKAGVQLKPPSAQEQAAAEAGDHLRQLLEEALTFFRHQLFHTPAGQPALEYLRHKRGLRDETLEAFGLGYAPASFEALLNHFRHRGAAQDDLLAAGLVSEGEGRRAGVYDRFRQRIMFPIRDERGRMAGFGARVMNPEDLPKFLNSPQTALFDKGRLLYGLERARRPIRERDQAVIVEGYLDVIALHQAGFSNTISPMGTALTEHQLYLLKRFSRRIVLALDPDAAGNQATLRGLQIARQAMDHEAEAVFDARGLLHHERRLQADIRVTTLPEGLDPDEVVNRDPQEWQRILDEARPVVVHVMETLAAGQPLDDPKVKSRIATQVLPLIEDVPDAIERDAYRQKLARLLRVSENALLQVAPLQAERPRRRPYRSGGGERPGGRTGGEPQSVAEAASAAGSAVSLVYSLEAHCLGVLLRRPDLLFKVDRKLRADRLSHLSPGDFQHAGHQTILGLLKESIDQDIAEPLNYVLNHLDLPLMELADSLLERTAKLDPNDERVLEDLMRSLVELRLRDERQNLEYLHFLMEEAQQNGELVTSQYQEIMVQHIHILDSLQRAKGRYTSRTLAAR
jgi:DNA primase